MAGEYAQQTKSEMQCSLGRDVCGGELYAAHFLGADAACKLIQLNGAEPGAAAANAFPQAAGANKNVFDHSDGTAKSVREVYNWVTQQPNVETVALRRAFGGGRVPVAHDGGLQRFARVDVDTFVERIFPQRRFLALPAQPRRAGHSVVRLAGPERRRRELMCKRREARGRPEFWPRTRPCRKSRGRQTATAGRHRSRGGANFAKGLIKLGKGLEVVFTILAPPPGLSLVLSCDVTLVHTLARRSARSLLWRNGYPPTAPAITAQTR